MVHVISASSLEKAVSSVQYKVRKLYYNCVTAIPGLSLNPLIKNPLKNLGNLLKNGNLARKCDLVIWHDLINNTLSTHWKSNTPASSPETLVKLLKEHKERIQAIVYCRRFGTQDVYKELKKTGIPVISVRKNLISKRKQHDSILHTKYSAIHQEHRLELKSLNIVLNHAENLEALTKNTRSKKTRPSQKKRQAKQRSK